MSHFQTHDDVMTFCILVSIRDDVVEYLVKRNVEGNDDLARELVIGAEAFHHRCYPRNLGHMVSNAYLAGPRRSRPRWNSRGHGHFLEYAPSVCIEANIALPTSACPRPVPDPRGG